MLIAPRRFRDRFRLTTVEATVAREIYQRLVEHGEWPRVNSLLMSLQKERIEPSRDLRSRFLRVHDEHQPDSRGRLLLGALVLAEVGLDDVHDLLRAAKFLAKEYEKDQTPRT